MEHLISSFQDLGIFDHNNLRQGPLSHALFLSCNLTRHTRNSFGHCFGVIVNDKPLNLEKTTLRVLSVFLLIYAYTALQFCPETFVHFRDSLKILPPDIVIFTQS